FGEIIENFKSLSAKEVAKTSSVGVLDKYASLCNGFDVVKGMPIACKAAYYHNILLEHLNLDKKYRKIIEGDKVKFYYTNPNSLKISVLAFKDFYPKEFEKYVTLNYEKMAHNLLYKTILTLYTPLGWDLSFSESSYHDLESLL